MSGEWRLGAIKLFLGCHKVVLRGEMTGSLKACFNRLRTPKRLFALAQILRQKKQGADECGLTRKTGAPWGLARGTVKGQGCPC